MSPSEFGDSFGTGVEDRVTDVSAELVGVSVDQDGVAVVDGREVLVKPDSNMDIPEAITTAEEFRAVMEQVRAQFSGKMIDFVMNPAVRATKKALYAGMKKQAADTLLSDYFSDQFKN